LIANPTKQQGQQSRAEPDVRTMERETSRTAPAADPAESEQPPAASSDARQGEGAPGALSSSDGTPVSGTPGSGFAQGGTGGTSVASIGRAGPPGTAGETSGGGQGAILREIRDSIMKNVIYPDRARRNGWEGRVIVSFTVYEDGSIRDARIVRSSGTLVLDDAAKEALKKSAIRTQFAKKIQVVLPIDYKLK